jgi:hypothetical protein
LRELHEYMMQYPEYRAEAIVVRGAVLPRHDGAPSILDVLGPDWARRDADVHIDNTVLEGERVEEKDAIEREERDSVISRQSSVVSAQTANHCPLMTDN